MLRAVAIRNFAIIDQVEVSLTDGFTAITGETGAGKSIVVDALGMLLGDRAESAMVAAGERQAELEARFAIDGADPVRAWLTEQAMDEGEELILRRVLAADGGSRAWINGRAATVGQLSELGAMLVEIHGQHEHQQLGRAQTQRRLLDGQVTPALVEGTREAFERWQSAAQALANFELDAGDPAQVELLRFQCRELDALDLSEGEFAELENEQERLSKIDDIRLAAARACAAIDQDDSPSVRALLHEAMAALNTFGELDPRLAEAASMLEEARINIDEAFGLLERVGEEDAGDPQRLAEVDRRLERALDLARKHRVQPEELPALAVKFQQRLDQLEHQGERRQTLEAELDQAEQAWREAARALSKTRAQAAQTLSDEVSTRLAELGMEHARLEFTVNAVDDAKPARHGLDRIGIVFAANPGKPGQPLAKVASGGELSRVALALMITTGNPHGARTRIFDEVDAGVGGETAHVVGRFLRQAAGDGQALCVTHLAQVAACANHQLSVTKQTDNGTTSTQVRPLDDDGRQKEIARMLGSAESEKSLAHAAEMLSSARGR